MLHGKSKALALILAAVLMTSCGSNDSSAFEHKDLPTQTNLSDYDEQAAGLLKSLSGAGWPNATIASDGVEYGQSPRSVVEVSVPAAKDKTVTCQVLMVHTGGGYKGTKPDPIKHKVARINGKPLGDFANIGNVNIKEAGLTKIGISRKDLETGLKALIRQGALRCT